MPLLGLGALVSSACYSTGDGSGPPLDQFYFPVGLQVSAGGNVLYVANSDFDLQFNGGTLQSYDLGLIRRHTLDIIENPSAPGVPLIRPGSPAEDCPNNPPTYATDESGVRQPLGQTCAPPVDSHFYVRDTAVIGAFATDMLLSLPPDRLVPHNFTDANGGLPPAGTRQTDRLFIPVRGNASLTWANVRRDGADDAQPTDPSYAPFRIDCGQDSAGRCDAAHSAGENPDEKNNSRQLTMPGEPFGIAMSGDGESILITHQSDTKTSLLWSGLSRDQNEGDPLDAPSLQFIADNVPFGGIGLATIPHLPAAPGAEAPKPAFLETSRSVAQVSTLRVYPDDFTGLGSSTRRPFLNFEGSNAIPLTASAIDSRGIAIDPTPRLKCLAKLQEAGTAGDAQKVDGCNKTPARFYIANRAPSSLLYGEVGASDLTGNVYNPDALKFTGAITLSPSVGLSNVYLAPIVDLDGAYVLRVFVVCFDSAEIYIFDPDHLDAPEAKIRVGLGPYAMAFDPFTFEDVAANKPVPLDPREPRELRRYRFAYVASFTNSFVQVIDLDNARADKSTFERVVFTLGQPTDPKGS